MLGSLSGLESVYFRGLIFVVLFSWSYFRGLIFVVYICPEHVIIVAYYPRILIECTDFRWLIFRFKLGLSVTVKIANENKTPRKCPAIR